MSPFVPPELASQVRLDSDTESKNSDSVPTPSADSSEYFHDTFAVKTSLHNSLS